MSFLEYPYQEQDHDLIQLLMLHLLEIKDIYDFEDLILLESFIKVKKKMNKKQKNNILMKLSYP